MKATTLIAMLTALTTSTFAAPIAPTADAATTEDGGNHIVIGSRDAARPWFVTYVKDYPGPPGAKLKRDADVPDLIERNADPKPARPAFISYHKPAYGGNSGERKRSAEPEAEAEARPPVYIDYTIDAYLPPGGEGVKKRDAKPVPPVVLNYDWMAYEPRDAGA